MGLRGLHDHIPGRSPGGVVMSNERAMFLYIVGLKVRELRKAKELEQQELADKAKISRPRLSQIENGKANMLIGTLYEVANALDIGLSELLPTKEQVAAIQEFVTPPEQGRINE